MSKGSSETIKKYMLPSQWAQRHKGLMVLMSVDYVIGNAINPVDVQISWDIWLTERSDTPFSGMSAHRLYECAHSKEAPLPVHINQDCVFRRVISGLPQASLLWLFSLCFSVGFFSQHLYLSHAFMLNIYATQRASGETRGRPSEKGSLSRGRRANWL